VLLGPHSDSAAMPGDLDGPESWPYSAQYGASVNDSSARNHPTIRADELVLDE